MVFSSTIFIFFFLPVVLLFYYLVPGKIKNVVLTLASLLFYTWGEDKIVMVMIFSILIDFSCGLLIGRGYRKTGLVISILTNLSFLGFFKYFNFTFENFHLILSWLGMEWEGIENLPLIALPIGISFYTFQTMSYTIDVYRGHVKPNTNILSFATYVSMFPQLVAGPIVRYADIHRQLKDKNLTITNFVQGMERFIIGLAKKMIIANTCAAIADYVFAFNPQDISTSIAWAGAVAYAFQIYFDFSGYSDMAIGLGKMFGFDFPENFNYPYIAKSIREFWRRWHISLSTWFRDYVYISLGGSRKKMPRVLLNLFIVFFVTGLWHGASWNFVVWGLLHGVLIVAERMGFDRILSKLWLPLQHIYTLLMVCIIWVFFRADDLTHAALYIKQMFSFTTTDLNLVNYFKYFTFDLEHLLIFLLAITFSMPLYPKIVNYISAHSKQPYFTHAFSLILKPAFLIALFFLCITYITAGTYNPFIYFRF